MFSKKDNFYRWSWDDFVEVEAWVLKKGDELAEANRSNSRRVGALPIDEVTRVPSVGVLLQYTLPEGAFASSSETREVDIYWESRQPTIQIHRHLAYHESVFIRRKLKRHRTHQVEARLRAKRWDDLDLVFCTKYGSYYGPLRLCPELKRILRGAGLPSMRFHDLRHSTATIMLATGVNPKIVQEILGHSNISITLNTYSHVLPHMQREAMKTLEAALVLSI